MPWVHIVSSKTSAFLEYLAQVRYIFWVSEQPPIFSHQNVFCVLFERSKQSIMTECYIKLRTLKKETNLPLFHWTVKKKRKPPLSALIKEEETHPSLNFKYSLLGATDWSLLATISFHSLLIYHLWCQLVEASHMPSSNAPTIGLRTRFTFFPDRKQSWCAKAKCSCRYDDLSLKPTLFSIPNALISTTF